MSIDEIKGWEQLIAFLEGWSTVDGDPDAYDPNGMLALLGACLTNLAKFSIDADFDEIGEIYEPAQIEVLRKILMAADKA